VLPLAPPGLALGILVRHLHLLERQRRRQHHLRPHYLRLHPLILSRTGEVEQDETKSPAVPSLRALGDVGCRRAVAELESHGLRPCLKQHGKPRRTEAVVARGWPAVSAGLAVVVACRSPKSGCLPLGLGSAASARALVATAAARRDRRPATAERRGETGRGGRPPFLVGRRSASPPGGERCDLGERPLASQERGNRM